MRSHLATLLLLAAMAAPAVRADWNSCQTALSGLNMVKEMLVPGLRAERLQFLSSVLRNANGRCPDNGELLVYWKFLAEKTGDRKMAALAQKHLEQLPPSSWEPMSYDPLKPLVEEAQPDTGLIRRKWALVVGVSQFRSDEIPPLALASKDASAFADFLTSGDGGRFRPERVRRLTNEQATLEGIRSAIGWLRENVQADDLVVIYFASHGTPRENDPNGVSYIAVNDTKLDNLYATSLQMIDLVQIVNRELKARRVSIFLDTCFSGDARRGLARVYTATVPPEGAGAASAFSGALQTLKIGRGRAVITASRADQESFESSRLGNGYFTYYLLRELRRDKGMRPLGTVFPLVTQQVSDAVPGRKQTPSFEFTERADSIVLGVPESEQNTAAKVAPAPAAAPAVMANLRKEKRKSRGAN